MADRYGRPLRRDRNYGSKRNAPAYYSSSRRSPSRDRYRERDSAPAYDYRDASDRSTRGYGQGYAYNAPRDYDRYQDRDSYRAPQDGRRSAPENSRSLMDRLQPARSDFNFTYEAAGAPTPRFPQAERSLQSRPRSPRDSRHHDAARQGGPGSKYRPQGPRNNAAPPRRRIPFQPSARDLLLSHTTRETTPEQLAGMNTEGLQRFRDVSPEDSEADVAAVDAEVHDGNGGAHKRAKLHNTEDESIPKWSNPDPYTSLPPPDSGTAKKDIVQVIRKAKVDDSASRSSFTAINRNADFISLDFNEGSRSASETTHGSPPPPPPTPPGLTLPTHEDTLAADSNVSNMKKRKHQLGSTSEVEDIVEEWLPNGTDATPWHKRPSAFTANVGLKLHMEIVDFYEFVRPREQDEVVRNNIIKQLQNAINAFNTPAGGVEVMAFGSYPQRLYLPTADMDLVILSAAYQRGGRKVFCQRQNDLRLLLAHLRNRNFVKEHTGTVIPKARVPLVKFTDKMTNLRVDISFENGTGIVAIDTVRQWARNYPAMPILVALVKQFLAMRNLDEVFHGGIGGFSIICLVVHMLAIMPPSPSSGMDHPDYGYLFLEFLDLYGNKFNFHQTGLIMAPRPRYFDKARERKHVEYKMDRLTIIDPNDPGNDIAGGSREISMVFGCFKKAHARLQQRLHQVHQGSDNHGSILACILGGNYTTFTNQRQLNRQQFNLITPQANRKAALNPLDMVPPAPPSLPLPPPSGPKATQNAGRAPQAHG